MTSCSSGLRQPVQDGLRVSFWRFDPTLQTLTKSGAGNLVARKFLPHGHVGLWMSFTRERFRLVGFISPEFRKS